MVKADACTLFPSSLQQHIYKLITDATNTLLNAMGQVVASGALQPGSKIIPLTSINPGSYVLQITTERDSGVYRVVK